MKKLFIIIFAFLAISLLHASPSTYKEKGRGKSLTLQDIYKQHYQTFWGTEHLAPDTASVLRYLDYELSHVESFYRGEGPHHVLIEPIGDYCRLSLKLVLDGKISKEALAEAFIESARPVPHAEGEWLTHWQQTEIAVLAEHPELRDDSLQAELMEAARLNAAVRHSDSYRRAYCPHYRIIRRDVLDKLVKNGLLHAFMPDAQFRHDSVLHVITKRLEEWGHDLFDEYKITEFGAKGDGIKDCKPAFDKAMRKIAKVGTPSRLIVPAGTWHICGPIHLVSHLELHLAEGAVLQFDDNPSYYLPAVATSWEGSFCYNYSPFIYGKDLVDISITGAGTIDGNAGRTFATWRTHQKPAQQRLRNQDHQEVPQSERCYGEGDYLRPHLIQLYNCRDVTLRDFFITNSPFWCVHLLQCEGVICDGLRYDAKLVNNDGIDPEMSRNVLIQNIIFNNGDDNVAIKAGRDNDGWLHSPSEDIIIRNCSFKGLHAVVIGSEMSAGVRNVWVEDCTYGGYCKRALYVKTNPNRGGFVHDIYFRDCAFDEVEDLFYITSMYAGEGADDTHFTDIHDIHAQDITCRKAANAALVLQGTEAMPLHDISFTRLRVGEAKVGFSSSNTEDIILRNCHLGGEIISAPSQVSHKDNLWR